jgi:hypothetical protein
MSTFIVHDEDITSKSIIKQSNINNSTVLKNSALNSVDNAQRNRRDIKGRKNRQSRKDSIAKGVIAPPQQNKVRVGVEDGGYGVLWIL